MSTNPRIYLDFNATAPLVPAARDAITAALAIVGNPSSIHTEGRAARDLIERARNRVAAFLGRPREQVVFTSGGTEANAMGVFGLASAVEYRKLPRVVVTTEVEHPSLRTPVAELGKQGWEVRAVRTAAERGTDWGAVMRGAGLVAIAQVNHEIGTVADPALFDAARAVGALVHVDAVQAAGKVPLSIDAHSIVISAHKLGGPQGVGALSMVVEHAFPEYENGHQERGRRPGTENTLGIVGFGAAVHALDTSGPSDTQPTETSNARRSHVDLANPEASTSDADLSTDGDAAPEPVNRRERSNPHVAPTTRAPSVLAAWRPVAALGDHLEHGLRAMGARIHGDDRPRAGGTINAAFGGTRGESIVIALDLAGIAASTGAACTSGSVQPSAVLLALGYQPDHAREAVRFSLGRSTTRAEIDHVLEVLPSIIARARRH
jgi:cysteine desulfurase